MTQLSDPSPSVFTRYLFDRAIVILEFVKSLGTVYIRCPRGHCRKVENNILLSTISRVFDIPSFQYVVWFENFATVPIVSLIFAT